MTDRAEITANDWASICARSYRDDARMVLQQLEANGNSGITCMRTTGISLNRMLANSGLPFRLLKMNRVPGEARCGTGYRLYRN